MSSVGKRSLITVSSHWSETRTAGTSLKKQFIISSCRFNNTIISHIPPVNRKQICLFGPEVRNMSECSAQDVELDELM